MRMSKSGRRSVGLLLVGAVVITLVVVLPHRPVEAANQAPTGPPSGTQLCGNGADSGVLPGPSTAPGGSTTVAAGDNSSFSPNASTTYYFAAGTHTFGSSEFGQIIPQTGDTFIGAPGAILNGEGVNDYALVGTATNVTVEHLTIMGFVPGTDASVVNHDGASNWTVEYNTIENNTGAGLGIGSNNIDEYNCLANNEQYGFNAVNNDAGVSNITLSNNEIEGNDGTGQYDQSAYVTTFSVSSNVATVDSLGPMDFTAGTTVDVGAAGQCSLDWCTNLSDSALNGVQTILASPAPTTHSFSFSVTTADVGVTADATATVASVNIQEGAGGGGKFWVVNGATVTNNWVHDNGLVGLWPDTDNVGFNFSGNYISDNWAEGIAYEISYNASITDNAFVDNVWGEGPSPDVSGFPSGAIYLSESGSDSRVPGPYGSTFAITGNVFTDNWGGVVIYENSNRACGITNDDTCTLVDPSTYTLSSCAAGIPNGSTTDTPDYVDNCRWKAQNISVTGNDFNFTPSNIGSDCTTDNTCGFNGLFSEYATTPSTTYNGPWPSGASYPYAEYTVSNNISNHQNNHFSSNTYCASGGSWGFVGFSQGVSMTSAQWTSGQSDVNGSGDTFGAQDAGSQFLTGCTDTSTSTTATTSTTTTSGGTTTTTGSTTTTTGSTTTTTGSTTATVRPPPAHGFVSATSKTVSAGRSFLFRVVTHGAPSAQIQRKGKLPTRVHFVNNHNGTGLLSGTPSLKKVGTYHLTFIATFGTGKKKVTVSQAFVLTVQS